MKKNPSAKAEGFFLLFFLLTNKVDKLFKLNILIGLLKNEGKYDTLNPYLKPLIQIGSAVI